MSLEWVWNNSCGSNSQINSFTIFTIQLLHECSCFVMWPCCGCHHAGGLTIHRMSLDMNEHGTMYVCGPNSQICYVALLSLPPRPMVTSSLVPDLPRGVYMVWGVFIFCRFWHPKKDVQVARNGGGGGNSGPKENILFYRRCSLITIVNGRNEVRDRDLMFFLKWGFHPLGNTSWKKRMFSFGHCPNFLSPPPLTPFRATCTSFFGRQNRRFARMTEKIPIIIMTIQW